MEANRFRSWWVWVRIALHGLILLALSTSLLAFPIFVPSRVVLEEGDVAPQHIRAPRPLSYESAIRTAEQQRLAEQSVGPVYTTPDADLARNQLERTQQVLDYLTSVRGDTIASPSQHRAWVLAVPELATPSLTREMIDGLLSLDESSWGRVQLEALNIVADIMRSGVREGALEEAREAVVSLVGLDLSPEEAAVTAALAERLIAPNSFYDEEQTLEERRRVRESVSPVIRTVESGEVIVREGQQVTALDLEALRELGLQQTRTDLSDVAGYGALALTGIVLLGLCLARFQPDVLQEGRKLLLLTLLLSTFLVLARLMVPDSIVLRYLFPSASLAMLLSASLGPHVALVTSVYIGGLVGLMGDHSLELAISVAGGAMVAALASQRSDRPAALFRAAFFAVVINIAVLVGFRLPQEQIDLMETIIQLIIVVGNGVLSSSIALGGLFLVGPLFDVVTTFRLVELSSPEHPLLQRLLREAPGTYHHTLLVANLAEQAAERIGADPLLTRVGAYYHDIGKVARPYFFIENQVKGLNPHEKLDPYTSAEIITGHVRDGMELARQYRLPSRVRAFIPEHHGSNRASFQYERAVELAGDPQLVNESDFRHGGPRPQSKETALVMLADSSEAAVRARNPSTSEDLAAVVASVFDRISSAGQLDECPLTLRELGIVQNSFVSALKGVVHPRIQYPDSTLQPAAQGTPLEDTVDASSPETSEGSTVSA
jgi:putative nucleotidyltransferase with HDIG domain